MSNPEQIRAEIELTRDELGRDVDALADKVTPGKIMERQKTRLRERVDGVRERVMGTADDVGGVASHAGHKAAEMVSSGMDAVEELPHMAKEKAQGAPLTVGLIAAGLGFLVASLIPPTQAERRLAASLREKVQPVVDSAKELAQDVAADLKEPAMDAVAQVKDAAASAAQTVKEETQQSASEVKESVGGSSGTSSGS